MAFVVFPYQNKTHKATSHGASPMKTQQKTVFIGEKLRVINQLEKGENTSNKYYAVGVNKSTVFTIFNNAEKSVESGSQLCATSICFSRSLTVERRKR